MFGMLYSINSKKIIAINNTHEYWAVQIKPSLSYNTLN